MAFTVAVGKRTLGLLLLLLAFGVAVRDVPEISNLLDDYSNDGVAVECQGSVPRLVLRHRSKQEGRCTPSRSPKLAHLRRHSANAPSFVLPVAAGKSRLRLLSILRD
jgi:hypothetical protein